MPRYPAAVWRPLPEDVTQPSYKKTLVIVHSQACKCGSLFNDFNRAGNNLESTFWVSRTGVVEQYLDTSRRADANRYANEEAISIETDDDGDPDRQPWWPAQVKAIVELIRWCAQAHKIPLARAGSPYGTGIGYHTLFGAPSAWTPVVKTCPGWARVRQFDEVILPALITPSIPPPSEEDGMLIDITEGLMIFLDYPRDVTTWDRDKKTSAAWWQEVAKQHGVANALTLMIAEGRKFGVVD